MDSYGRNTWRWALWETTDETRQAEVFGLDCEVCGGLAYCSLKMSGGESSVCKVVTECLRDRPGFASVQEVSSVLMVGGPRWRPRGTYPGL